MQIKPQVRHATDNSQPGHKDSWMLVLSVHFLGGMGRGLDALPQRQGLQFLFKSL